VISRRLTLLGALLLAAVAGAPTAHARAEAAARRAKAAKSHPLSKAGWLHHVLVTEYYPAPEAWFVGKKVAARGLTTKHRIDWLYSATGVSMQGTGIGLDGRTYHIDALGKGGWVNAHAKATEPGRHGWSAGPPVWRDGAYWLTHTHELTFPLDGGGWSAGTGRRYVRLPGVSFARGASKPLRYYKSIAVDPGLIPLGSRIYIAAYRHTAGGGWFRAQDTGGAIDGRHVDVYRSPPASPDDGASTLTDQRIYVIPPGAKPGRGAPPAAKPAPAPPPPSSSGGAAAP
jgi:3D (Asp-Asp-Asp) domain-containing protein